MKYNPLGDSGLMVSEACLGTMIFGEESERSTDEETALQMIDEFIEAGGNFIDTANVYADGVSEKIVGKALKKYNRDDFVLATKVRFSMGEGPNKEGLSRKHIIKECRASLERLGVDTIDLYYLHSWDPITPIEETMRALKYLIDSAMVKYIGVCNFKAWQVMKALENSKMLDTSRFIAAQYQYSLVERNIEGEFISMCENEGMGLVPWGPLGGGFLSGKYEKGDKPSKGRISTMPDKAPESWHRRSTERNWEILDKVGEIAENRGKTHPQVALSWLRQKQYVSSIIVGARTPNQLEENLSAFNWDLTEKEVEELDEVSLPMSLSLYPYRFIRKYSSR